MAPAKPRDRNGGCLDRQLWLTEIGRNFNHAEYRVMHYLTVVCGPKLAIPYTWAESEQSIAARTGVGVRTVARAIAKAVDLGFVSIVRSGKGQYSKACSVYRLEGSRTNWQGQSALVAHSYMPGVPIAMCHRGITNPDSSSTLKSNPETDSVTPPHGGASGGAESGVTDSVSFSEEERDGNAGAVVETPGPAVNRSSYNGQAVADFMATLPEYPDRVLAHRLVSRYAEWWLQPHVPDGWRKTPEQAAEWYSEDHTRWRQFIHDLQDKIIRSGDIPDTTTGGTLAQEALTCETCHQDTTEYQLDQVLKRKAGPTTVDRCNGCLPHRDDCLCRACVERYNPDNIAHVDTCCCLACKVAERKADDAATFDQWMRATA